MILAPPISLCNDILSFDITFPLGLATKNYDTKHIYFTTRHHIDMRMAITVRSLI